MSSLRPVILSGGSGTRLWPLSTPDLPKQFVPLFDNRSLFDLTLRRLEGLEDTATPLVVTGAAHTALVEDALDRADVAGRILIEPAGRNTAPAAVAAALDVEPEDVLMILPSDHLVTDLEGFRHAVGVAVDEAREGGIVTFGARATRPETGYGYIEVGDQRGNSVFAVRQFKEKPDQATAAEMVEDGRHLWNSGMFIARSDHLIREAESHCPGIVDVVKAAMPPGDTEVEELSETFLDVESESIDYAIMERTKRALVVPIDVGWDDVGSYRSLLEVIDRDAEGNHIAGDVLADDVTGSFIRAGSRKVVVAGLRNVVVVETPYAVLVVPLERSQEVGDLSRRVERT